MADPLKLQLEILATGAGKTVGQIRDIQKAIKDSSVDSKSAGVEGAAGASKQSIGLAEVAFRFNNVIGALQNLRAAAQPVYDALISSNEKLNAQILSSQTNLASSTRIFQGDQEITDPTEKINATRGAIKQALREVEIATQALVGVTSSEVNELFQITLTNAASLNNQSKQFPDAIASATALTKGWAASLKVIGVPLNQAGQEINSILKGQIDQNSILAKNLGITNAQVGQWQAQGRLVDELNKRLDVFVAGNAIAARSIDGIGSNIKDLIERIGRNTGEPLLEPIISALAEVEKYLKKNEEGITTFFRQLTTAGASGIEALERFKPTFEAIEQIVTDLSPIVATLFKAAIDGTVLTAQVLQEALKPALANIEFVISGLVKINDLINYRGDSDALEALEQYGEQALRLQDAVGQNGIALRKLQAIEKDGGALTAEQLKQRKALTAAARAQVEAINAEITELKNLQANNPAILAQRNNQIKALEAQAAAAEKNAGGNRLEAKSLEVLGTTAEQYARKVTDNQRQLKNEANGQAEDFKKAAKEAVDLAKTGVESKQITVEAARAQLQEILSNTKVDLDAQIAAKKAIDELVDGRIAKVKELIEVGKLQADDGIGELSKVRDDSSLEPTTRRKAAQQIVAIRKEQIAVETAAIAAQQAQIATLQAEQRLGEQIGDQQTTGLKIAEIDKQIEAQRAALDNATSDLERGKILEEIRKTEAEKSKMSADFEQRERKRLVDDFDFRRNLIKAEADLGLTSQTEFNQRATSNNLAQVDLEIQQQKDAQVKLAENDNFGYNQILAKTSELQSKRVGIIRQYDETAIKLSNDYYDQYLRVLEALKASSQVSEGDFVKLRLANRLEAADAEIKLQQVSLDRLGKNDVEGRNAIEAKIYDLRGKRIAAFDQLYQAELEQIKRYQAEANSAIQQSEAERSALAQAAANRQLSTVEQTEQAKLDSQRKSLLDQLDLAKTQEVKLTKLSNQTRSPESERAYQAEVRAARLNTAQATLRLLEQEGQQIQAARNLAIRAIEDQQSARSRAADTQLSQINATSAAQARASRAAESAYGREQNQADQLSKSLDRQNNLFQARVNLAKAIEGAADATGNIEAEKVKSAIELTKQLQEGNLSDRQRIEIQDRLNQLVGSNTLSIAQLTARQAQAEQGAATRKEAALKLEQSIAQQNLTIDQNKNDLANKRLLIEARIAELKAKQAVLDAQAALQARRINDQRAITAAQADLDKAKEQAPGRDRDQAVLNAQGKLDQAKQAADTGQADAQQSIALAKEQVDFAGQAVTQAKEQISQQTIINTLQRQTLDITQATARSTYDAAEAMRQYASAAERAKAAATGISPPVPTVSSPTVVVPQFSQPNLPAQDSISKFNGAAIEQAVKDLQKSIEERPPAKISPSVTFGSPTSAQSDEYFKMLRSIERGAV